MKPNTEALTLIDDLGHSHHVITWMVILELEGEGVYPINTSSVQQRTVRWWGEFQKEDRVSGSMGRLLEYGLLEREEVEEWPHGYHLDDHARRPRDSARDRRDVGVRARL